MKKTETLTGIQKSKYSVELSESICACLRVVQVTLQPDKLVF